MAREKVIDREIVLAAMADAIQKAARSRYGTESNIRADINPKTGEIRLQRLLEVVEKAEDYSTQIPLELARDRNPDAALGDFIADRCRRWISAVLPPSRPSRSSSRRFAKPSVTGSSTNSRIASAKLSTVPSSASNMATSSSISAVAKVSSAVTK
ncbi:hypothetical protein AJ87_01895 [Rhizobium yanglingense]|nr:hypothetical protein AJ87_01895 [Rhizobium yanglingense]